MPDMSMRTPQSEVVDMDTHFNVDDAMDDLVRRRFAMSPVAIAAFRQAAVHAVKRLLHMITDDATFEKMTVSEKLKVMEMVFDRAYGKTETASTSELTNHKTGQGRDNSDHASQMDAIQQRMQSQRPQIGSGNGPIFPELKSRRSTREAVRPSPSVADDGGNVVPYGR